jgi:hypothetical protein
MKRRLALVAVFVILGLIVQPILTAASCAGTEQNDRSCSSNCPLMVERGHGSGGSGCHDAVLDARFNHACLQTSESQPIAKTSATGSVTGQLAPLVATQLDGFLHPRVRRPLTQHCIRFADGQALLRVFRI